MTTAGDDAFVLIERIYDAATDPAQWPDALLRLTEAVGGAQVMMGVNGPDGRAMVLAPRMDPVFIDSYRDRWGKHDILWQRTNAVPAGTVLQAERFAPAEELHRMAFYHEWYRPLGLGAAGLGVNLYVENGVPALCGIKRAERHGPFSSEQTTLFHAVAPHLVRAADIQRRLERADLFQRVSGTSAGRNGWGVVLVDEAGRPIEADDEARSILDDADGLCLENGRVRARERDSAARLAGLIDACFRPASGGDAPGGSLSVPRGQQRPPLLVDVAPLGPERSDGMGPVFSLLRPTAVITITDTERAGRQQRDRLIARYGLTRAEADVTAEISRGDGREAAAERLGISVETARTHLMRVFDKTGVNRQAELVRLYMELGQAPIG